MQRPAYRPLTAIVMGSGSAAERQKAATRDAGQVMTLTCGKRGEPSLTASIDSFESPAVATARGDG